MTNPKFPYKNGPRSLKRGHATSGLMLLASAGVTVLTGCAGMVNDAATPITNGTTMQGKVFGGQQPISGATIQLYAAQTTGYAAAAAPLISTAVTTDANGNFSITGDYTCPASPNDLVYLTATGGNSGSGVNSNIVQVAALGPCSSLSSSTYITISEVSTVAAAYALAGFATDSTHVGTSSANYTGLKNAFATVNNLVDLATGNALTVTPAYATQATGTIVNTFKSVVPQSEIYTLANILSSCVNTNGVGGASTNCSSLFSYSRGNNATTPSDTFTAALAMAQNPGNNVTLLYNLAPATPPFAPSLASAPNDWTIALNFVGGGLGGPTTLSAQALASDLAIDASGNVWTSDGRTSRLTELSPLGAPISPNTVTTPSLSIGGFSGGGLAQPTGLAFDLNGAVWLSNGTGTISEFSNSGSAVGSGFSGGGLSGNVTSLAVDTTNNIWAVSAGGSVLSKFDNNGNPVSATGFNQNINSPFSVVIDASNNVWVSSNGNGYALKFDNNGNQLGLSNGASIQDATPFTAIDGSGNFVVPNSTVANSIQIYNSSNAVLKTTYQPNTVFAPSGIAIDGLGHIFVTNGGGNNGAQIPPNVTELTSTGTALSPTSTGFTGTGTSVTGAGLITLSVKAAAVDGSGNLWILNGENKSTVTEFVGIGAPTVTPLVSAIKNNKVAVRP